MQATFRLDLYGHVAAAAGHINVHLLFHCALGTLNDALSFSMELDFWGQI